MYASLINPPPQDGRCPYCKQERPLIKTFEGKDTISAVWGCTECLSLPEDTRWARMRRMISAINAGKESEALRITNQLTTLYNTLRVIDNLGALIEDAMAAHDAHSVAEELWLLNSNDMVKELEDDVRGLLMLLDAKGVDKDGKS